MKRNGNIKAFLERSEVLAVVLMDV